MKKIEAYKTSDGQIFELENKAIEHEREIGLEKSLNLFAEEYISGCDFQSVFVHSILQNLPDFEKLFIIYLHNDSKYNFAKQGNEVGEMCNRLCTGIISEYHQGDGCSCHTGNPPCNYCTSGVVRCNVCETEIEY